MDAPTLVIAGASGVIGRHLIHAAHGYRVTTLTRRPEAEPPAEALPTVWKPLAAKEGDDAALHALAQTLDGAAAVVNLAGASIANGRLGEAHKRLVLESRVESTRTLLAAHKLCDDPPPVWFQASGTNFYGDAGDDILTEASPKGEGFLSDVCKAWEASVEDANGARLLVGRIGVVLARDAPGWKKMVLPVRLFVGGSFGSGRQWYPWIDADDLAEAILFLIEGDSSRGVYNLTAPKPVRQGELAKRIGKRLGRPTFLKAPPAALRLAAGGVTDAVLLPSVRALPTRLEEEGFTFEYPNLERELDHLL